MIAVQFAPVCNGNHILIACYCLQDEGKWKNAMKEVILNAHKQ